MLDKIYETMVFRYWKTGKTERRQTDCDSHSLVLLEHSSGRGTQADPSGLTELRIELSVFKESKSLRSVEGLALSSDLSRHDRTFLNARGRGRGRMD